MWAHSLYWQIIFNTSFFSLATSTLHFLSRKTNKIQIACVSYLIDPHFECWPNFTFCILLCWSFRAIVIGFFFALFRYLFCFACVFVFSFRFFFFFFFFSFLFRDLVFLKIHFKCLTETMWEICITWLLHGDFTSIYFFKNYLLQAFLDNFFDTNSIQLLTGSEDNSCFVWPDDWTVGRSRGLRATVQSEVKQNGWPTVQSSGQTIQLLFEERSITDLLYLIICNALYFNFFSCF
jgi:hypothetical protein